jgi:hypothetical protein
VHSNAAFDCVLPLPGGGSAQRSFADSKAGNIVFAGQVTPVEFKFLGHGAVAVTVRGPAGLPLKFVNINLVALGGDFNGFSSPQSPVLVKLMHKATRYLIKAFAKPPCPWDLVS